MASEDAKRLIEAVARARSTGDWGAYDGVVAHIEGKSKPAPKPKKSSKKEEPKEEKKSLFSPTIAEPEEE